MVAGLALFAASLRRALGLGEWGRARRHPHLVFWTGFVVGTSHLLMSDTPPVQFFTHTLGLGLVLGGMIGVGLAQRGGTAALLAAVLAEAVRPSRGIDESARSS